MHKFLTTIIFSIILFFLVFFTAYNYHTNEVLESRINTALKFSCDINSEKSFKEDYYILQQSHDTNLILVIFGLAIAVMGFFTYRSVVERFDYKTLELINDIESSKALLIKELNELKVDYFSNGADIDSERSQAFLDKGNLQHYISYALSSVDKNLQQYLHEKKVKPNEDNEYMMNLVIEILDEINENVKAPVRIADSANMVIEDYLKNIRRTENAEVHRLLSKIQAKFNIISDEVYYKKS